MCGICGIWNTDGKPIDLGDLRRATDALRHRGPDDEGYLLVDTRSGRTVLCGGENSAPELGLPDLRQFAGEHFDLALGFRRLAILDLSPAGHQPMASSDRRLWLIFNGEIYNYLELREELAAKGHLFHTSSDSEVILAAYQEWGENCLTRFNGMWGLAIWDSARRVLFAARDRLGVKPFYTTEPYHSTFAFASEIKALVAARAVPFRPSPLAVARYVGQGGLPSHMRGATMFEGVRELPAAHYLKVQGRDWQPRRYWRLPLGQHAGDVEQSQAVDQYHELFTDSVRLRLRADVAIGTCLSGGLDSSSIVAVAGELMRTEHAVSLERLGDHQQTFSAVYDIEGHWNERRYMDMVLDHTGAAGNFVVPTGARLWDDMERLVWHQDEPFQSTSIFAQWCVMDLARRSGVTVLLDGQGADELLGGYRPFAALISGLLRSGHPARAVKVVREVAAMTGMSPRTILARALQVQLPAPLLALMRNRRLGAALENSGLRPELGAALAAEQATQPSPYTNLRSLDTHLAREIVEDSLPNLLRYEDRNSMAFSIEARVPFLDYRLVEYAFTAARPWRIHKGWTKWIGREAVAKMLPSEIVWRRDKVGFETPEQHWLSEGRDRLLDMLAPNSPASEYIDMNYVRRELPRLLDTPGNATKVWRWANLALWLDVFGRPQSAYSPFDMRVGVEVSTTGAAGDGQ